MGKSMNNRKYLFLAIILIVGMVSIAAASAADTPASDVVTTDDTQDLNLEENIQDDISTNNDNGELILGEGTSTNDGDDKEITSKNKKEDTVKASVKPKAKKAIEKESTKSKKSSKTTFKTIGKNSKDKATVKKIQKALKKNGYYLRYKGHYLKVDGWYGPCTVRSVKAFQKAKKLKVTGKVDEKTAEKLKIIDKTNAKIKFENDKTFTREYNSGKSFDVKIVNKTNGKGIETILRVDYYKNGKRIDEEFYYTNEEGINYITPDYLKPGTYKAKVSCEEPNIKVEPKYKTIIIKKTSIILKAKDISSSGNENIELKANLKFKNNKKVNEGKVKFTVDGKSYTVNVKDGVATKTIKVKNLKSNKYQVAFLGTKNIKSKSATGKIA